LDGARTDILPSAGASDLDPEAERRFQTLHALSYIRAVGRELQKTNYAAFILQNGFREIWIQDAEYSFAKDGEFLGSAAICVHPADQWLKPSIYSVHRRVGLTNKDVYMPLEPPSKGGPLIAMWLPDPPKTK
jgi:hypothetical protein